MFYGCSGLTALNVSSFDTANVTDMSGMFQGCRKNTWMDIYGWDISKVEAYENFMDDGLNINGRSWEYFFRYR